MPRWHLETIYWPDLFLLFTHSCNAISGRQYLSRVLHLSVRSGTPVRPPWLDAAFPQALHFYWADPRWIATVKRRTRWSVFCCYGQWRRWQRVWKYADDATWNSYSSEFRRGSVSTSPLYPLSRFPIMLAGISLQRWCDIVRDSG